MTKKNVELDDLRRKYDDLVKRVDVLTDELQVAYLKIGYYEAALGVSKKERED